MKRIRQIMNKIWMYLILVGLVGCGGGGNNAVDREKIKQEMKDREIKRVSGPELMDAAFKTGGKLADVAESILLHKLHDFFAAIPQHTDSSNDARSTYASASELIMLVLDSLSGSSGHELNLINPEPESLHPDTSAIEKQLLEAYQYNMENNIPPEDNVQRAGNDYLLFTRPITSKTGVCLPALLAGMPGYESDSLKRGETYFCGMWSIKLSKREIIRAL